MSSIISNLRLSKIIKSSYIDSLLYVFLGIFLLNLTYTSPVRSLLPLDIQKRTTESETQIDILNQANPAFDFTLAISPDLIISRHYILSKDLNQWARKYPVEKQRELFEKNHELFSTSLALQLALKKENNCNIQLRLGNFYSNKLACEAIKSEDVTHFNFPDLTFIPIGEHKLSVFFTSNDLQNNSQIQIKYYPVQTKKYLEGFSQKKMTNWKALIFLFANDSLKVSSYIMCLLAFLLLISFAKITFFKKVSTLILIHMLSLYILSPALSGYDETHHIYNFMSSFLLKKDKSKQQAKLSQFNSASRDYMIDQHFFRFHNVQVQEKDQCPHYVLKSCYLSSNLIQLYGYYQNFFPKDELKLPKEITYFGRAISGFLFLSTLIILLLFVGKNLFFGILISLTFYCGFTSQLPSLSNDLPMFFLGVFILGFFIQNFFNVSFRKQIVFGCFCWVLLFLLKFIDRSWVSALPFLCLASLFFLAKTILGKKGFEFFSPTLKKTLVIPISVILGLGLCFFVAHLKQWGWSELTRYLSQISRDSYMIYNASTLNFSNLTFILIRHFKSFFGSYIWGHSYFSNIYYILNGLLYLLSWISLPYFLNSFKEKWLLNKNQILGFAFSLSAMIFHLFIVVAVASGEIENEHIADTFSKVRLTAPGSLSLLIFPALFVSSLLRSDRYKKNILQTLSIQFLILSCYYYPKFFIGDVF